MRNVKWIFIVLLIGLAGCGYNPEEPVYDTAANPDGFPSMALNLLDRVEAGELIQLEAISFVFAELYTSHPQLLDNPKWTEVIERLGSKFRHMADQRRENGLEEFTEAADLYILASFARPEDDRLERTARLFSTWSQANAGGSVDLSPITDDAVLTTEKVMPIVRHFLLSDPYHREFFDTELLPKLRQRTDDHRLFADAALADMAPIDRVLAIEAGLVNAPITDQVARFEEPKIDLAAYRVQLLDSVVAYELYLVPRDSVVDSVEVFLMMQNPVARPADLTTLLGMRSPVNQDRVIGDWQRDRLTVCIDTITAGLENSQPKLSIAARLDGDWEWLSLSGTGGSAQSLEFEQSPVDSVATQ